MFYFQNIADRIIFKFQDKNFAKGISTLIGAAIINFLTGSSYSLCTLSVYEISYIKGIGGDISIEHLTFYHPVGVFFQCISTIISGTIFNSLLFHNVYIQKFFNGYDLNVFRRYWFRDHSLSFND